MLRQPTCGLGDAHKENLVGSAGKYCSNRKQANYCQLNGRFIAYAYWISRGCEIVETVHHSLRRCREDRKGGGGHGSRLSKTFASSSERWIEKGGGNNRINKTVESMCEAFEALLQAAGWEKVSEA